MTMTSSFALAAARAPHRPGFVDDKGMRTWQELEQRAAALAVALRGRGAGGNVAIMCRNHAGLLEAIWASNQIGVDSVLLNTGFAGPQLADVLKAEGVEVIIYDEEFARVVAEARSGHVELREILAWNSDSNSRLPTMDQLIGEQFGREPPRADRTGRIVLLTSGTTGTPKGAVRSASGILPLVSLFDRVPWHTGETAVIAAPMFHSFGFGQMVTAAVLACTIVTTRRFDPATALALVDEHRATSLHLVPVMLERIVDLPSEVLDTYGCSSLRFVVSSGSTLRPASLRRFAEQFGDVLHNMYGQTEAGLVAIAGPSDLRVAPTSAGRPVVGTEVRLLDDAGRLVAPGEVGRIAIRSDTTFEGYTSGSDTVTLDGFVISGDVGKFDDDGRLHVIGRDDEMIVSGGENVHPLEVEEALSSHPAVREVAVVAVEDADFGQRLAAFVAVAEGADPTPDELREYVRNMLADYKVPRDVEFRVELPRNASGKIMKRLLSPQCSRSAPEPRDG
jgi:acyl-CoA synthetase (AMP-forming)/AMP-acid ligase II